MKLFLLLVLGLAIAVHGEVAEKSANDVHDEPDKIDAFENDDGSSEEDLEAVADPDELEALEESEDMPQKDPAVIQSIAWYCRFCKVYKYCRRIRRCSHSYMRRAARLCKFCNPRTYWNLVRRIRIRIRLRRIRVRRIFGRRRRRRRRRFWG